MSDFLIQGVPAKLVPRLWPFAEPYIKRALEHASGEIVADDLKLWCMERDVQLWLVAEGDRILGAATTEIVVYPQKKHCRVITIAGSRFAEWVEQMDAVLTLWSAEQGCNALEAHVRKGFVTKLAPLGYKHLHSVVVKKLPIMADVAYHTTLGAKDGQEEQGRRPDANHGTESGPMAGGPA